MRKRKGGNADLQNAQSDTDKLVGDFQEGCMLFYMCDKF